MAEAGRKLGRIMDLAPAIQKAERSIVFAQTMEAARRIARELSSVGVNGAVLTSDMTMAERKAVFAAFEDGEHDLVAAPMLLDEGIDVPAADLAIIVATSRSRRQLIQRMGRVVRKKSDGRMARVVILYVEGTAEDPETGAHEDFLEIVTTAARDIRMFPSTTSASRITAYLNDIY